MDWQDNFLAGYYLKPNVSLLLGKRMSTSPTFFNEETYNFFAKLWIQSRWSKSEFSDVHVVPYICKCLNVDLKLDIPLNTCLYIQYWRSIFLTFLVFYLEVYLSGDTAIVLCTIAGQKQFFFHQKKKTEGKGSTCS